MGKMGKMIYEPPMVRITKVVMEESIAQVRVSIAVYSGRGGANVEALGIDTSVAGGEIYLG